MEYQQSVLQCTQSGDDGRLLDKMIAKFEESFRLSLYSGMLLWKDVPRNCYVS